jgi:hypothetical protein
MSSGWRRDLKRSRRFFNLTRLTVVRGQAAWRCSPQSSARHCRLLVAARNDTEEQAGDRDRRTVIDPAGLINHEALSRVREITRALRHEDEAGDQNNDRDNG